MVFSGESILMNLAKLNFIIIFDDKVGIEGITSRKNDLEDGIGSLKRNDGDLSRWSRDVIDFVKKNGVISSKKTWESPIFLDEINR